VKDLVKAIVEGRSAEASTLLEGRMVDILKEKLVEAKKIVATRYGLQDYLGEDAAAELNELSKKTLGSYIKKATNDVSYHSFAAGDEQKGRGKNSLQHDQKAMQRQTGVEKATDKIVKEEPLDEGRPSQRHPLEGHDYHKKTGAALNYIAKDAHAAAEAMKGGNTAAENKYRDQVNDSDTVRHWRQKNGMPDWYKKKYGHVKEGTKEEVEALDEAVQHSGRLNIIKARIRKGKVQRRKKVSAVAGYTLRGGKLTRMTPTERRKRRLGQRRGKIKRRRQMSRTLIKRKRSLVKRKAIGIK